jgi:hypothetical protein
MCLNTPSPTVNKHQAMSTSHHGMAKRPKKNLCLKRITSVVTNKPNITVKDLLDGDLVKNKPSPPHEVKAQNTDPPNVRLGTKAFIQIMLHTRNCSSCEDTKCKKMKLVMSHYIKCTKLKNGQHCPLCRQLIRVISEHAMYLCPNRVDGIKFPCPVPMCDIMRASAALKKNI